MDAFEVGLSYEVKEELVINKKPHRKGVEAKERATVNPQARLWPHGETNLQSGGSKS